MKYKIIVANKEAEIDEDEIDRALKLIGQGGVIVLRHIIFNSVYFQAIVPDKDAARNEAELKSFGYKEDKRVSEFAKLLSPKMKMLSDQEKTKALEEAAAEEKRMKSGKKLDKEF